MKGLERDGVAIVRPQDRLVSDSAPPSASVTFKNQQFSRLNAYRRERTLVDIYLVSGVRLRGRIRSFDQYSLILDVGQGETFLYHHAVSSIGPVQGKGGRRPPSAGDGARGGHHPRHGSDRGDRGEPRHDGRGDGPGHGDGPRGDFPRHAARHHGDDAPPMRRPLGAPKPATEVTVVRRVSRKINLPPKDGSDPTKT